MVTRVRGWGMGLAAVAYTALASVGCADGMNDDALASAESALTEATLPAGTAISVHIATPGDGVTVLPGPIAITGNATVGIGAIPADTALVYVIDASGSTTAGGGCGGNVNGDGFANSVLDCEIVAAQALDTQADAQDNIAEVGIVVFGQSATVADLSGIETGVQMRRPPGLSDIDTVLTSIVVGHVDEFTPMDVGQTTNYADAMVKALDALATSPAPRKIVVFLSDGFPTAGGTVASVLPLVPANVDFYTFAVGASSACASSDPRGSLAQIAAGTGGTCTQVTNVATLPSILPGVIGSQLTGITLTVDGAPVAATLSAVLPQPGAADVGFSANPVITAPGLHEICATAAGTDAGGADDVTECIHVLVNAPPEAICQDVTVLADATCHAPASINNGSFDPDGPAPTCTQTPPGPFALGATGASLACVDAFGGADACTGTVTVVDKTPPSITCPADQVRECVNGGAGGTYAATAIDNCSPVAPTCSPPSGSPLPLGTTPVTCQATDASGNAASCGFSVKVADTKPPVVTVKSEAAELWPPNHQYVGFSLASCVAQVKDACGGPIDVGAAGKIIRITSDEPEKAPGSGNTCKDAVITGATTANLRAERIGSADGRVYTVHFEVMDASGNVAPASCQVHVPHDQGPNGGAVDSGCKLCTGTGCGSCPAPSPTCN